MSAQGLERRQPTEISPEVGGSPLGDATPDSLKGYFGDQFDSLQSRVKKYISRIESHDEVPLMNQRILLSYDVFVRSASANTSAITRTAKMLGMTEAEVRDDIDRVVQNPILQDQFNLVQSEKRPPKSK